MYNFLGLVNDVNNSFNDVELSASNFSSAVGHYAEAKKAVNNAIMDINHSNFAWPFNYVVREETLVPRQTRYAYQNDAKDIRYDSFRIKHSDSLNVTSRRLDQIDYEEYLDKFIRFEDDPESYENTPNYVFRCPNLEFGVTPPPDKAYTLVYEYYRLPTALSAHDDVPSIPENFRYVINEGSMYYAHKFRDEIEKAAMSEQRFQRMLSDMRSIYVNRYPYVRSTYIERVPYYRTHMRVG